MRYILLITFFLSSILSAVEANEYKKPRVLMISSYNSSFPTFFQQIEGVKSVLKEVDIDIEFMDAKRFVNDDTNQELFYQALSYKLKNIAPYDAVLLADDAAFDFALKYRAELFPETPLVFFGVNNKVKALKQNEEALITGVVEDVSVAETIKLMIDLFPRQNKMVAIVDATKSGKLDLNSFQAVRSQFPDTEMKVINLADLSFDEYKLALREIHKDVPVLLLSAYQDKTLVTVDFEETLDILNKNLKAPLFHLYRHGLGDGVLGGKVISHINQGKIAASLVQQILSGTPCSTLKVIDRSPNRYVFDYNVMAAFGIKLDELPPNSLILNNNKRFFYRNKKILITAVSLFLFLLLFIVALVINTIRRRRAELSLIKQNKEFTDLNKQYKNQNTALKIAQKRAEQSESRFRYLFDHNPISLWEEDMCEMSILLKEKLHDKTADEITDYINNNDDFVQQCASLTKINLVNKSTIKMFGFDDEQELLVNFISTFTPESFLTYKKLLLALALGETTFSSDTKYLTKDGRLITAIISAFSFHDSFTIIIAIVDTTPLTKAQLELEGKYKELNTYKEKLETLNEALVEAKDKAEESDRLKTAFLANMSHEIRTPMNGILGFSNLLKNNNLSDNVRQRYIDIINKSGDRMLNTINDIIDISKIQAGEMKVNLEEVNLGEELIALTDFFKAEAEAKGLLFEFHNHIARSCTIKSDFNKLTSIITNLIKNAIKYTDEGFVKVMAIKKDNNLYFEVSDSGVGIPFNRQDAVFERFIQSDIEDSAARQGSGLGLAITKSYVEMLGGVIHLSSTVNKGSVFSFSLPWNDETASPLQKEEVYVPEVASSTYNILIAEDDDISFLQLEIILEKHHIVRAFDGQQAVDKYKNEGPFDLILMDIGMPILNGYEATKCIREFDSQVKIIAQTAFALEGDREKALLAGCDDYIAKPINSLLLMEKINLLFRS